MSLCRLLIAPVALLAALSASGLAYGACDPSQVLEIEIKNMAFVPAAVEACVGQTIRWTNTEPTNVPRPMSHTVTADPALAQRPESVLLPEGAETFDSGRLTPGQSFETVLTVAGEYRYFCRPHELMGHLGVITVVEPEVP